MSERRGVRTTKSLFGLIAMAIPVIYFGGLLLYFNHVRSSFGGLLDDALGPTMLGLGAIGLLLLIPLVVKVLRLFGGRGGPGASGGGRADKAPKDEGSDFDPDAALARYMARRSSGAGGPASPPGDGGPARRTGFGRRLVD
jgi:hypothetical protein